MKLENTKDHISFLESEREAPLVMLIHGFPNNASMWKEQIEFLKNDYHVLAVNLPGSWNGEKRALQDYCINKIAANLAELLIEKSKGKGKVFVVGHDLGAFIAHEVALLCEKKVSGVVFISGMPSTMFKRRFISITQLMKSFYVLLFNFKIIRSFAKNRVSNILVRFVYSVSKVSKDSHLWISSRNGFSAIDLYRQMTKHVLATNSKNRNAYNSLFIFGKEEKFLNLPTEKEISKDQKKSSLKILPGGHWLPATHPALVNSELSDFFLKAKSV